ncbi:uncharacterized protein MELLADRAFT_112663 [Melampsora larici-populina 98AG31]|uniref:Uncharacterized protein n=1 Tax=Melampsora larici-populina (strain 98AG31 / pathotype 3-4-7) TaxID=747676 RepID=F4S774_MELLP|nr:uncharacterized protein MELLADRAFT_112663 [Melampsora larici-populina 98AG31]EGF99521.1 hypothetical protein MELLADRAFT_112663 [Melampsora larici-populina 98AG31]
MTRATLAVFLVNPNRSGSFLVRKDRLGAGGVTGRCITCCGCDSTGEDKGAGTGCPSGDFGGDWTTGEFKMVGTLVIQLGTNQLEKPKSATMAAKRIGTLGDPTQTEVSELLAGWEKIESVIDSKVLTSLGDSSRHEVHGSTQREE